MIRARAPAVFILLTLVAAAGVAIAVIELADDGQGGVTDQERAEACPSKEPQPPPSGDLTFQQIADAVAEAISCPGYAFHVRYAEPVDAGPYSSQSELDAWVDLASNRARSEFADTFSLEGNEPLTIRLVLVSMEDASYTRRYQGDTQNVFERVEASSCHAAGRGALEQVISCRVVTEGPLEDVSFGIEETTYRGRPAIALVKSGMSRGSDEIYDTTFRLYVDRATFLPLGETLEGTLDVGDVFPVSSDLPYEYGFVRIDELPADHFDPASIGYVIEDFERALQDADIGVPVYWLGDELPGEGELPRLVLDSVRMFGDLPSDAHNQPDDEPYPVAQLNYAQNGETAPAITLKVYLEADWRAYLEESGLEEEGDEIMLPDGEAIIDEFVIFGSGAGSNYRASFYAGGAVVRVAAPRHWVESTLVDSTYNSERAIGVVLRNLRRLD